MDLQADSETNGFILVKDRTTGGWKNLTRQSKRTLAGFHGDKRTDGQMDGSTDGQTKLSGKSKGILVSFPSNEFIIRERTDTQTDRVQRDRQNLPGNRTVFWSCFHPIDSL